MAPDAIVIPVTLTTAEGPRETHARLPEISREYGCRMDWGWIDTNDSG